MSRGFGMSKIQNVLLEDIEDEEGIVALAQEHQEPGDLGVDAGLAADATLDCPEPEVMLPTRKPRVGDNPCNGTNPFLPAVRCVIDGVEKTGEQSGTNVTLGYTGLRNVTSVPITAPFFEAGLCPVNVHWHLGTEHYSLGQYDETGSGPSYDSTTAHDDSIPINNDYWQVNEENQVVGKAGKGGGRHQRELAEGVEGTRMGFQCTLYDETDPKFTTPYAFQHCKDMQVGETYEVHWPHSAMGACGTVNQYQSPFYDGVFCRAEKLDDTASQIGVQGQVFVIVNDEDYYYPDLIRGMIVDGDMGIDVVKYTGSTTGTSVNNEVCSQYTPITWQVDRKCHMISASTFGKWDDSSTQLHPSCIFLTSICYTSKMKFRQNVC